MELVNPKESTMEAKGQIDSIVDKQAEIKSRFTEIIRQVSLLRLKAYAENNDFKLKEASKYNPHGYVFANYMAMIIIAGQSVKITFKTFFNHQDSKPIARYLYNTDYVDHNRSLDVIKEYCNLTAGYLKKILVENDIMVGISLPIATRGFNEVFWDVDESNDKITFEDCWQLVSSKSSLHCSYQVEIMDTGKLNTLTNLVWKKSKMMMTNMIFYKVGE